MVSRVLHLVLRSVAPAERDHVSRESARRVRHAFSAGFSTTPGENHAQFGRAHQGSRGHRPSPPPRSRASSTPPRRGDAEEPRERQSNAHGSVRRARYRDPRARNCTWQATSPRASSPSRAGRSPSVHLGRGLSSPAIRTFAPESTDSDPHQTSTNGAQQREHPFLPTQGARRSARRHARPGRLRRRRRRRRNSDSHRPRGRRTSEGSRPTRRPAATDTTAGERRPRRAVRDHRRVEGGGAPAGGDIELAEGEVFVTGSSTVEPISIRVGELAGEMSGGGLAVTVEGPGTATASPRSARAAPTSPTPPGRSTTTRSPPARPNGSSTSSWRSPSTA